MQAWEGGAGKKLSDREEPWGPDSCVGGGGVRGLQDDLL